ncbi:hypothetical protein F5148DRAFT_1157495 [Russula earlei]|uniref:Uncharacterized protein n=1 Tax=Russula earlei TaxID=71964 RepID=A0ACC0UNX9_9AGAM|nr:hypothetical protein F5148DRAFT_1157495 [Russula earlei]
MSRRLPAVPHSSFRSLVDGPSAPDVHKVVHTYTLNVCDVDIRLSITIEPVGELSREHTFFLTLKAGPVERPISEPATLSLSVDPRTLEFVVFAYPPRACLPQGCLYSLRVWLRSGDIDHRLFSEDALWIGKDPDFNSIQDAVVARLRHATSHMLLYKIAVGRTLMDFILRWRKIFERVYSLSLEYDGCGVGRILFNDFVLGLDCPPDDLDFVIYTIPVSSTPQGATHRIRLWLRVPAQTESTSSPTGNMFSTKFIYQRIWGTDSFKVGNSLDFTALGPKLIVGVPNGDGPRVSNRPRERLLHRESGLAEYKIKHPTYGEPEDTRKEVS